MTAGVVPDASSRIGQVLRNRWCGVRVNVRRVGDAVVVDAPALTGRTGRAAVGHAINAVLGGRWVADAEVVGSVVTYRRVEV